MEDINRHFGKRPPPPTERELLLAGRCHMKEVTSREVKRRLEISQKHEAAARIQRAWKQYFHQKGKGLIPSQLLEMSRDSVHKKRLRSTQEEWERQIAALTIQLAWRKFYRRKLLSKLHPNRRQLQLWDPEIVALKQEALLHYVYNEQLVAPFWHPRLRAMARPLWTRFIPSPAAVSYNFAVDQYVPWIARLGGVPFLPEDEEQEEGAGEEVRGGGGGPKRRQAPRTEESSTSFPRSKTSMTSDLSSASRHSQSRSLSSGQAGIKGDNRASRGVAKNGDAPKRKTTFNQQRISNNNSRVHRVRIKS